MVAMEDAILFVVAMLLHACPVQYVLSNSLPIGLVVEVDYYRYWTIKI